MTSAGHNPYTPPDAAVADRSVRPLARPRGVNVALWLIGATLAMQIFVTLRDLMSTRFQVDSPWPLAGRVLDILVFSVVLERISRGKGWARAVLLAINVWSFALLCYGIGLAIRYQLDYEIFFSPEFLFPRTLPMMLNFVALHLLYFSSGDWFASRKTGQAGNSSIASSTFASLPGANSAPRPPPA